jgi:hypothetical protein
MAEPNQITFTYKEVAEALVKKHGIHQGIWGLYVRFGIKALNIGDSENSLKPSAIIPILDIGLQKFDKENSLSVDAARVNPKKKSK